MSARILIIDEDSQALQDYRGALAPKSSQWDIDYAASVEEGLTAAQENKPTVIIADLSIAGGHGADILAQLEKIAPDAQRFITATEADKPKLESTLGSSFQYLPSPCPAPRLITEIQRSIAIDNWLGNDRIKELVAKMGEFPSLPPIYLKVVNALNSRHADTGAIAESISGDLAISAKVLQTVNSSFYGFDQKIANISEAINILGTDCVKNLVLAIQVFNTIGNSKDQKAITDELWHHSMSVAVAARRIVNYELKDEKAAEEAYTAGLMHDIGKLILLNAVPELFAQARELAQKNSIPQKEAEDIVIGCNHAETGAYLLARWGMPTNLTEAVALHHDPVNSFGKTFSALAAVHVANAIVHQRQKADHPSAVVSEEFLVEIGKSDSWQDWLDVTSGKKPQGKSKSGLSPRAQESNPAQNSSPAKSETVADQKGNEQDAPSKQATASEPSSQNPQEEKSSKTPFIALAACAALAAVCIYALNTIDSTEEFATEIEEPEVESALASTLEKARDLSGLTQTEDALQEIFDSQDENTQLKAVEATEPDAVEVADADTAAPEPETAITPTAPAPDASTSELVAATPEPMEEEFPKPKLPEVQDTFPNIELAGIFYNDELPLASVNGKIRRVGDTISGAQIIRIDKTQIIVKYEQTLRAFKLN